MQTVSTEELFNALLTRGTFDRKAMFCNKCIDYARQMVLYYRRNNQMNISATMNSPISDNNSPEARGLETRKTYLYNTIICEYCRNNNI